MSSRSLVRNDLRFYGEDLTYVHDTAFYEHSTVGGAGVIRLLRDAGVHRGTVVELGCGSGLLADQLVTAGYEVFGLDVSKPMIELARSRVPDAEIRMGSLLDGEWRRNRATIALGEVLNYALAQRSQAKNKERRSLFATEVALANVAQRIFERLEPGGVFISDVAGPGRGRQSSRRVWAGEQWGMVVDFHERGRSLERRIACHRVDARGRARTSRELHTLELVSEDEARHAFTRIGFRVRIVRRFGELELPRGLFGVIARRPRLAT